LLIECAKTIIFFLLSEKEDYIPIKPSSGKGFSQSYETLYQLAFQR